MARDYTSIYSLPDSTANRSLLLNLVGARSLSQTLTLSGNAYSRRIQSRIFGKLARWLLPITTRDTQAGLKGMTAEVAERVLPNLTCDGFGFDCELLTACARYEIPITEVPVCVRYDDAASSTGGLKTIVTMLRELWRIRRRWPKSGFPDAAVVAERVSESQAA